MTKYSTIENDDGCVDYRTIADKLTLMGDEVGHSTVRNTVIHVMERFAYALMTQYDVKGDPNAVARMPAFQKMVASLLQDIYSSGIRPHGSKHGD